MKKLIAACTTLAPLYPGFVNFSRNEDGSVDITVRGDPTTVAARYICGYARDKGQPGRCTPGDDHCNNYCNQAPEKGRMQDSPLPCDQTHEGEFAVVKLTAAEWEALISEASK
ncbi:hypothetical protein [Mesorhizobium sp.]|uniref:hypothetical protein n=1 Tax=Mesorhizobium sp. TaxID=1871066 RepID=UPI000FE83A40|nr:hypothetical protein [Mesorhizobium sp.]RWF33732.1 MAG: hypothetical protein EOS45_02025 [Mesorhizobium sp.]